MEKAKKVILIFFVISLIVLAGLYAYYIQKKDVNLLFYGANCHYCKEVDEFIKNNSISSKIDIKFLEIENNQTNAGKLNNIVSYCNIKSEVNIPFIFSNGQCYMGKDRVLEFLNKTLEVAK